MTHALHRVLATGISAAALFAGAAQADEVFIQDVIVQGSLCVGVDCVNGENFGFDTIRMKENNTRIKFQDTSASASFPTVDWQLTANESNNGGLNKFSIESIDNSRIPFTVEYGAGSNALYVDDGGRIGLGTASPVVELHVVNGDSPAMRLEQDGSSGFAAQTWDLAGNETNFFVRDVTNGSRLPFKIRPSAPTNSLFVDTDGDIGIGTASPDAPLDIERAGPAFFNLTDTTGGDPWTFQNNGGEFRITRLPNGSHEQELVLDTDGNLKLEGFLSIRDGVTAPAASATPNQAQIYVDIADGDLKVIFSDGTIKVLATDTP